MAEARGRNAASDPATVVISLRVRDERTDQFLAWQGRLDRLVAHSRGFLGTELAPPNGGGGEWTVIYRFDSREHLQQWLSNPERARIIESSGELFETPPTQRVVIGEEEPISVVVTHRVDPADEEEFAAWAERMTAAEREFPGFRGSEIFRPVPGVQEDWTTIFRFDTPEQLEAWLDSDRRRDLLAEGDRFRDFELHRVSSPFGNWFSFADGESPAPPPPSWKTAISVLVGLYPTVFLLTLGTSELWEDGPLWATLLVGNVLSVSLLTWVVMPLVTGALAFWLAPDQDRVGPRLDLIGVVASVLFLTATAAVFWLATTQVWDLP